MRRTRRKTKRKTKIGGSILGKGLSGTVYYPALECKNNDTPRGNYVSKLVSKASGEKEFENTKKLRELQPEYAIYPEFMCESKDFENKYLLFSKFGGYSLSSYYTYLESLAYKTKNSKSLEKFNEKYFDHVISALKKVKQEIRFLNEKGIYQGDISYDNILYDEDIKKAYLIDFERNKKSDESEKFEYLINELLEFKSKILK